MIMIDACNPVMFNLTMNIFDYISICSMIIQDWYQTQGFWDKPEVYLIHGSKP